jgi:hypothetical protein
MTLHTPTRRKRKNSIWLLLIVLFLLPASLNAQDTLWSINGDTAIVKNKPIVVRKNVVIYNPKKKRIKEPRPVDNHLYFSIFLNNQVHKNKFKNVEEDVQEYVNTYSNAYNTNKIGAGIGLGIGFYTRYWIQEGKFIIYNFAEIPKDEYQSKYGSVGSVHRYGCIKYSIGYRVGRGKLAFFPKAEIGYNIYDRSNGAAIDPQNTDNVSSASKSKYSEFSKFTRNILSVGVSPRLGYQIKTYSVFLEPSYGMDLNNIVKSHELYDMRRKYWGLRFGIMFHLF